MNARTVRTSEVNSPKVLGANLTIQTKGVKLLALWVSVALMRNCHQFNHTVAPVSSNAVSLVAVK